MEMKNPRSSFEGTVAPSDPKKPLLARDGISGEPLAPFRDEEQQVKKSK